jgi:uncharacterized membrane protein
MLLPVHITAGGLAILLGGVALAVRKGGTLHRRSGILFVYAMLTMGISGSILALRQSLTNANVLGGSGHRDRAFADRHLFRVHSV